jgi:hypothetical protein
VYAQTDYAYAPDDNLVEVRDDAGNVTTMGYGLPTRMDGSVWAWGYNAFGQLGDGTTTSRSSAVWIDDLEEGTAVVAAGYHSLGRELDGRVPARGRNDYGQLGDGTTIQRNCPVPAASLAGMTGVTGGNRHSLARDDDRADQHQVLLLQRAANCAAAQRGGILRGQRPPGDHERDAEGGEQPGDRRGGKPALAVWRGAVGEQHVTNRLSLDGAAAVGGAGVVSYGGEMG